LPSSVADKVEQRAAARRMTVESYIAEMLDVAEEKLITAALDAEMRRN
jgi:hypothetical protein